jgi:hypothetical protein
MEAAPEPSINPKELHNSRPSEIQAARLFHQQDQGIHNKHYL